MQVCDSHDSKLTVLVGRWW